MRDKFFFSICLLIFLVLLLFFGLILDGKILGYAVYDNEKGIIFESEELKEYNSDSPVSGINNFEIHSLNNITLNQGDSREIELKVRNAGVNYLNDCEIKTSDFYSSWISSNNLKGLAPGEKYSFLFEVSALEKIYKEKKIIPIIVSCDELNKSVDLQLDIIEKTFEIVFLKVHETNQEEINISYSIKELAGKSSDIDIELILMDSNGDIIKKINERAKIESNSEITRNKKININELNSSEIKVALNVDSKKYSCFVIENVLIGQTKSISGFSVSDNTRNSDKIFSLLIVSLFLVFSYFTLRKIISCRKKVIIE